MRTTKRLIFLSGAAMLLASPVSFASPPKQVHTRHTAIDVPKPIMADVQRGTNVRKAKPSARTKGQPGVPRVDGLLGGAGLADLRPLPYYGTQGLPEGYPQILYCENDPQQGGASNKVRFRVRNAGVLAPIEFLPTLPIEL